MYCQVGDDGEVKYEFTEEELAEPKTPDMPVKSPELVPSSTSVSHTVASVSFTFDLFS